MKRRIIGVVILVIALAAIVIAFRSSALFSSDGFLRTGRNNFIADDDPPETKPPEITTDESPADEPPADEPPVGESSAGANTADEDTADELPPEVPATSSGPSFTLSRKGKNVVVLFIDRALGADFPFLVNEKPELVSMYDGFTYYSNVISFGGHTNFGAPALMGGYEYTPVEMNKRSDERLVAKHNESMKVMPVLFSEHGFDVTVCDAPYGNYYWSSDLSIYKDYPEIKTFRTTGYFKPENPRAFSGLSSEVINSYEVLVNLPAMTEISNDDSLNFFFLYNDTPHQIVKFREPEYVPDAYANNSEYDAEHKDRFTVDGRTLNVTTDSRMKHYQTNMGTMLEIGKWLDYLKESEVYDNTKIIIVADHGYYLHQLDELDYPDHKVSRSEYVDVGNFFPLLLVKDFGAHGFETSDEFMTNADVPTLACEGVIENPVNPFTGNAITNDEKTAHDQYIITNHAGWSTASNNGCTFSACTWAAVTSNIWDRDDWKFIDNYMVLTDHKIPNDIREQIIFRTNVIY